MRKLAGSLINPIAAAALGQCSDAALWKRYLAAPDGSYLKRRLWAYFVAHESQLSEPTRTAFANHKWNSQWFFDAWFGKPLSLDHVEARFRMLRQIRRAPFAITALDDLGTANGSFLREASNALPDLEAYRGWEISQRAVAALRAKYTDDARLQFFRTDIDAIVSAPGHAILTTSGTLQYMPEVELRAFLAAYAGRLYATICLSEITSYGLQSAASSSYRAYETYNHDYLRMLAEAGFDAIASEQFSIVAGITWVVILARLGARAS